jgi:mannose-6-phosphate isomerase-like protein (cupin superfamily)
MAIIILQPGEKFSHYHDDSNESCCIKGKVKISFNDSEEEIGVGGSVRIPPGVNHILHNIGDIEAHIECAHAPRDAI